jgi:hypothetical protein
MAEPERERESAATAGVSQVKADFEWLGWGSIENTSHDLGTDLAVMARDARRFDHCRPLGVQVKAGASYFEEPETDDQGALIGWWLKGVRSGPP